MRVVPYGLMATIAQISLSDEVTVREQHRKLRLVRANRDTIFSQHIWPIREIGDAAEAFSFALRTERAVGHIQPFERKVRRRIEACDDDECARIARVGKRTGIDHDAV